MSDAMKTRTTRKRGAAVLGALLVLAWMVVAGPAVSEADAARGGPAGPGTADAQAPETQRPRAIARDVAVILDISGSMCYGNLPPIEGNYLHGYPFTGFVIGPGRAVLAGGASRPRLALARGEMVPAEGTTAVLQLNDVRAFTSVNANHNRANFGTAWASFTPYWQRDPDGSGHARAGIIMIDDEVMQITAVNAARKTITVKRGQLRKDTNELTPVQAHAGGAVVKTLHGTTGSMGFCAAAGENEPGPGVNGPHQPFDDAVGVTARFIQSLGAGDRASVVPFAGTALSRPPLSGDLVSVAAALDTAPALFYPQGGTNAAHALAAGRLLLTGDQARTAAIKMLVLVTDGAPNTSCSNRSAYESAAVSCTTSSSADRACPEHSRATMDAIAQAAAAKAAGVYVQVVGLGTSPDDCALRAIASAGNGSYTAALTTSDLATALARAGATTEAGPNQR